MRIFSVQKTGKQLQYSSSTEGPPAMFFVAKKVQEGYLW